MPTADLFGAKAAAEPSAAGGSGNGSSGAAGAAVGGPSGDAGEGGLLSPWEAAAAAAGGSASGLVVRHQRTPSFPCESPFSSSAMKHGGPGPPGGQQQPKAAADGDSGTAGAGGGPPAEPAPPPSRLLQLLLDAERRAGRGAEGAAACWADPQVGLCGACLGMDCCSVVFACSCTDCGCLMRPSCSKWCWEG